MRTKSRRSGVYCIENLATGDMYIGSSITLAERKAFHFWKLRNGKHYNKHLQSAFDKYGEEAFCFKIIEYCESSSVVVREQFYINELCPKYNKRKFAESNAKLSHTEETKKKMSLSALGRKKSPEAIKKSADSRRGKPMMSHAKHYPGFISPNGEIFKDIFNLRMFCREHGLNPSQMCQLSKGKSISCKKWRLYVE